MAITTTRYGLVRELNFIATEVLTDDFQIGLFTDDFTPTVLADNIATFTEPTWDDYERQNPAPWSQAVYDAAGERSVIYSELMTFEVGSDPSPQIVYGYFGVYTDGDDIEHVVFAERLPSAITPIEGVDISLLIRYRLRNPA